MANSLLGAVPVLVAALAGSLLPDIDSDESATRQATGTSRKRGGCIGFVVTLALKVFGGHRALTHTLLAWLLVSVWVGTYFHGNMIGAAFIVAYLSHLVADAFTVQGVPLLWPLWRGRIRFLPKLVAIRTGGWIETVAVIFAAAMVLRGWL
jgi:inner membrane protein